MTKRLMVALALVLSACATDSDPHERTDCGDGTFKNFDTCEAACADFSDATDLEQELCSVPTAGTSGGSAAMCRPFEYDGVRGCCDAISGTPTFHECAP